MNATETLPDLQDTEIDPSTASTILVSARELVLADERRELEGTGLSPLGRIGRGGMGDLYEAVRAGSSERVVVKLLRRDLVDQDDMRDRMRVEAEALVLLDHPNIVRAVGSGTTHSGRPYIVLERLEGRTLREELRARGALPCLEAIGLTRQLLAALGAVHDAGLVHRDVKPENLIVTPGVRPRLKLLDFGIAKVVGGAPRLTPLSHPTMAGACVGTPRYASPEQASGRRIDHRADIYTAGILLYTMLAGRGPFDDIRGIAPLLEAHMRETPAPPSRFARRPFPIELDRIVMKAMAKRPDDRYPDAASFSRELVLLMGRLCLPMAFVRPTTSRDDDETIADVALRPRRPVTDDAPTVVAEARWDIAPTVVVKRPRKLHTRSVSQLGVILSAAAFAALASGAALWLTQ
jgi:eukaryotic-like serine/threonine-protein kinase